MIFKISLARLIVVVVVASGMLWLNIVWYRGIVGGDERATTILVIGAVPVLAVEALLLAYVAFRKVPGRTDTIARRSRGSKRGAP